MIRIGVLSEHPSKPEKRLLGKYTKEVVCHSENPFELVAVKLPYSTWDIEGLSAKKRKKIFEKGLSILREGSVDRIILTDFLQRYSTEVNADSFELLKKRMFPQWAYLCVKILAEKQRMDLLNAKVCIRDGEKERISRNLMRELCYDTRNLIICTDDVVRVKADCEAFADESGMRVKVTDKIPSGDADVFIDGEACNIRFGRNMVVDGVAFDYETGGFLVDMTELTACVGKFVTFDRKISFFSGKKKLTL